MGLDILLDCLREHNFSSGARVWESEERGERLVNGSSHIPIGNKKVQGVGLGKQASIYMSNAQYCRMMVF